MKPSATATTRFVSRLLGTNQWLQQAHAEARRAQEDPERDAAFQIWKDNYLRTEKASRSLKRKHRPKDASQIVDQPSASIASVR